MTIDLKQHQNRMLLASHTMPGPSAAELNTVWLLIVVGPAGMACLLSASIAPCGSLLRRGLAVLVGVFVGTFMLTLVIVTAAFAPVVVARNFDDVGSGIVLASGVVLLALLGSFCLVWSVRATLAACGNLNADRSGTADQTSPARMIAAGWVCGLLAGLVAAILASNELPIAIGATGGTLVACWKVLRNRR